MKLALPMLAALCLGVDFHARRLKADAHRHPAVLEQFQAVVVGEIGHIGHGTDIDAFVFHRCAHSEAAHAAFEKGHIIKRSLAGQVVDFVAVVVKLESVFIGRRCALDRKSVV